MNHDQVVCIGVGGAGTKILNTLAIEKLYDKKLCVINTDRETLELSKVDNKILIGEQTTKGQGSHSLPEVGAQAFAESYQSLVKLVEANEYYVIIGGLGGGTGTGAIPEFAKLLEAQGKNFVVIVTMPFAFEGFIRMNKAKTAIDKIKQHCKNLIIIKSESMDSVNYFV